MAQTMNKSAQAVHTDKGPGAGSEAVNEQEHGAPEDPEAVALWDTYMKDRTTENSNALIEHYLYMVRRVVLRMSPMYNTTFRDYDDLVSNGVLGLIDAIQRFDPARGIKFSTYAPQRIRGAILDYMREQDWVPGNMRKVIKRVHQASDELAMNLGYQPEREELAKHLKMSVDDLNKVEMHDYQASVVHFENLMAGATYQASFQDAAPEPASVPDENPESMPEENYLERETRQMLADMIRRLSEKEQMVLDLYYQKEMRLKEIADIMGLTESRISQIHRQAIKKVSKMYAEEIDSGNLV